MLVECQSDGGSAHCFSPRMKISGGKITTAIKISFYQFRIELFLRTKKKAEQKMPFHPTRSGKVEN